MNSSTKSNKSILGRLTAFFSQLGKLSRATLDDGTTIIEYVSDELAVGDTVDVIDTDGNATILADGSYKTEDGLSFTIVEGVVSEVTQPAAPSTEAAQQQQQQQQQQAAPAENNEQKPAPVAASEATKPDAQKASTALKSHFQKFATGTPEERLTNLETMMAAVMEYCFGWRIEEKDRNSTENEAIDIYINSLKDATQTAVEPVATDVAAMKKQIAQHNSTLAKLSKFMELMAQQPAGGKTFPAVGFSKKAGEEQQDAPAKHTELSAVASVLAAK